MKKLMTAFALVGAGLFVQPLIATAATPMDQPPVAKDSSLLQLAQTQPAPAKKGATSPAKGKGKATKTKGAKGKKNKGQAAKKSQSPAKKGG